MSAKIVSLSGIRGAIARHMMESLASSAQITYFATVDASHLMNVRKAWIAGGTAAGYEDLLMVALRKALELHPQFNGVVRENSVELHDEVRVSIAIALPSALVAPAMPDIRHLSVPEIWRARRALIDRAKQNRLTVAEMKAGTITISNLGATRVERFTPILNGGQIALLGVGRIVEGPVVLQGGQIGVGQQLSLSLTTDHRVVDGAPSGAFLSSLADVIERDLPQPTVA